MKHSNLFTLAASTVVLSALATSSSLADQREFAEDVASALCAAIGTETGGNTAAAAGGVACKYLTRAGDSTVKALIDKYFDGQDQKFADATCTTIVYKNGKTIKPSANAKCS
jgi:hypothetical protein